MLYEGHYLVRVTLCELERITLVVNVFSRGVFFYYLLLWIRLSAETAVMHASIHFLLRGFGVELLNPSTTKLPLPLTLNWPYVFNEIKT